MYRLKGAGAGRGGAGRGGAAEDFRGDHLIFRRTKGGISRNWEPKRGDHWKLWKDSVGGPLKFAYMENEDVGGIAKVIKSYRGGITLVK